MSAYEPIALGSGGVLAPGRLRWLRALGWMVALFVLVVAASALPILGRFLPFHPAWMSLTMATLAVLLSYLVYAGAVRRGERRRPSELAPGTIPRDLGIGLLIGLGMFSLVFASLRLLHVYALGQGDWNDWPQDIVQNMLTGLAEELVFRAIVFRLLMRAFGAWWALALSAAIFGALHLANPNATLFAGIAIAVEAGLMLASFYLLTGRLWMSVGVHAAWNFAQGSIFGARVSGGGEAGSLFVSAPAPGASALLSGGAFGPEASLSAIIVGLAVFLVVIAAARKRGALALV